MSEIVDRLDLLASNIEIFVNLIDRMRLESPTPTLEGDLRAIETKYKKYAETIESAISQDNAQSIQWLMQKIVGDSGVIHNYDLDSHFAEWAVAGRTLYSKIVVSAGDLNQELLRNYRNSRSRDAG